MLVPERGEPMIKIGPLVAGSIGRLRLGGSLGGMMLTVALQFLQSLVNCAID